MTPFSFLAAWDALLAHSAPLLPTPHSLPWLRHTVWSLVLVALVLLLGTVRQGGRPDASGRVWCLALLGAVWAWVPGTWGLVYWLHLAFQTPSLVTGLLALSVVARYAGVSGVLRRVWPVRGGLQQPDPAVAAESAHGFRTWSALYLGAGVVLGWVLSLDTIALLPGSVYAWGFQPSAFILVCGLASLPWVLAGAVAWRARGVWQLGAAVALFGLWRWPSGNVWDALLDPWLWFVLNGYALRAAARYCGRWS